MIARGVGSVEVTVDGAIVPADLASRLATVRVASRLGLPTQCELGYATHRGAGAEHDRIRIGAALTVRLIADTGSLFDGEVTCVAIESAPDGETTLVVRGYDLLHRLRKRQRLRVFTDLTVAELAGRLCAEDGLSVSATESGPTIERVVQHGQTDLGLLTEVASAAGLYPVVDRDKVELVSLAGTGSSVDLELGTTLLDARVEANLDRAASTTTALGWQMRTAQGISAEASSARVGRGVRSEPAPDDIGLSGEFSLVDQAAAGEEELAARAQASLDARASSTVTLSGTAEGNDALRAGSTVEVTGLAEPFTGRYVLTEAVHTVDAAGYLTRLSTEPPVLEPERHPAPAMTLGVVTDVDDPQELGRVQVTLPAFGDADAAWMPVLCPGAGEGRGVVVLPDTGDTVLVAQPHGPSTGIVLGSLYGSVPPYDTGVVNGKVQRWSVRTGGGQTVVLDDVKRTVTVANKGGSRLRLAPGKVTLHAAADLDIEAPGRAIRIRGATVDFEHAPGGS